MPKRPPIPKLAASAVAPLRSQINFNNQLLRNGETWQTDVKYLRDTYDFIYEAWDRLKDPQHTEALYKVTEPGIRELLLGLIDVVGGFPNRADLERVLNGAKDDFEMSLMHSRSPDYEMGAIYQSYALMKIHSLLETLSREATHQDRQRQEKMRGQRVSSRKTAYGKDISGETQEYGGSESIANEQNQENQNNLDDTAQSWNLPDESNSNRLTDSQAEKDFPELVPFKHKHITWPHRD